MKFKYFIFLQICLLIILSDITQTKKTSVKIPKIPLPYINIVKYALTAIELIMSITGEQNNEKFQKDLMASVDKIIENTQKIEKLIVDEADRIIDELKLEINMQRVHNLVSAVDFIEDRFENGYMKYFMGNSTYEPETVESFIDGILDVEGFRKHLFIIRDDAVPSHRLPYVDDDRLFQILQHYFRIKANHDLDCDLGLSAHQLMYAAYNAAMSALSKGYIMVAHAYKYKQMKQSNNPNAYALELKDTEREFRNAASKITEAARTAMLGTPRDIRRCDPDTYIQGVNFKSYQFLSLFIPYDKSKGITESQYKDAVKQSRYGARTETECSGDTFNCISSNVVRVCLAPPESGRKYDTIVEQGEGFDSSWYYKGHPKAGCDPDPVVEARYPHRLEACLCRERYSQKKGALLNMTAHYSDVQHDRVVTGVRFVTRWSITYIEIQEGTLVDGALDPASVRWNTDVTQMLEAYQRNDYVLPQDYYKNTNPEYTVLNDDHLYNDDSHSTQPIINIGRRWLYFNLDDIILPQGMVVTGVKFTISDDNKVSLGVAGTRMFNEFGKFKPNTQTEWFSVKNNNREHLKPYYIDSPLYSTKKKSTRQVGEPGKSAINFQLTHYSLDASQTLIPLLDLQEVTTTPAAPLAGLSLFYKREEGFAGFLSLKLISFDYTIFFNAETDFNQTTFE